MLLLLPQAYKVAVSSVLFLYGNEKKWNPGDEETMNVIAWYCCTNGVDLKIVNLFIAIFILSRVYNLLRGCVNIL